VQPGTGRRADTQQVQLLYRFYAILTVLLNRTPSEGGQTTSEYAILVVWIALLVIVGAKTFGSSVARIFSSHATQL
jgi:Flp pilus assembly pilin Flp